MAMISTRQQMNMSFLSYSTSGLPAGKGNTISEIATSVSHSMMQDAYDASHKLSQSPLMQLGTLVYTNGNKGGGSFRAEPVPAARYALQPNREFTPIEPLTIGEVRRQPWEFQSQRIYGNNEEEKTNVDAGFTVDTTVNNPGEDDDQTQTNLRQAAQIKNRMGIAKNDGSLESLARDLAVFGMDLTALNDNPEALVEKVRERTLSMLDKFAADGGSVADRNRITGASARLVNGIQSSAGAFFQVDSTTMVDVDGTEVNGDAAYSVGSVVVDPLILDMNGDGIDLSSAEEGVQFDMDGDGTKTQTAFIRGDDALLFEDTYGDGMVRDGSQLFGNTDGHANGFDELASHDDNGDGVIDRNDAVWDTLKVWVEKTQDGVTGEGETMSLDEAGIESIDLGYDNVREDDGKGNLIGQTGSFTREDGSTGFAADAWLQELRNRGPF